MERIQHIALEGLPRVGRLGERLQSYNVEMVEIIGGRFWKPYGARNGAGVPDSRAGTTPTGMEPSLYRYRPPIDLSNEPLVPAGGLISLRFPVPVRLRPDGHRYPAAALLAWLVLIYLLPARLAPRHACSRSPTPRQLVSVGREHPGRWPSRRRSCRPPTCCRRGRPRLRPSVPCTARCWQPGHGLRAAECAGR